MNQKNVGGLDRVVRLVFGVAAVGAGYYLSMWWLAIVGTIVFLTGFFRWCGAYSLLGISTCKVDPDTTEEKSL